MCDFLYSNVKLEGEVVEWSKALSFFNLIELEPKTPDRREFEPWQARSLVLSFYPPRFAPRSKIGTCGTFGDHKVEFSTVVYPWESLQRFTTCFGYALTVVFAEPSLRGQATYLASTKLPAVGAMAL